MYRVIEGKIIIEGKEYLTYGIAYNDVFYVNDVSTDKDRVVNLVELCNKGRLNPVHLNDVVENFLVDI